ncbi:MAG: metal ABC transporter permease, partial [Acetobacterales bacterium]
MSADLVAILGPAVAICLMVALVHVPLGIEVLNRGIVFIDLAIAQIAGLVIVLAGLTWHEPPWLALQAMAGAAAVIAAIGFRWIERKSPREQEAVIGASFIVAASATLLALANHPHGGEEIQHVLSGQVLFVTWHDVARMVPA